MNNFKPLYNLVLVKPLEIDYKTKGGLIMTENNVKAVTVQTGEVIAVGDGMVKPDGSLAPLQLKVGDTVVYYRGRGDHFKSEVDGELLLIFKETDILGTIPKTVEDLAEELKGKPVKEIHIQPVKE